MIAENKKRIVIYGIAALIGVVSFIAVYGVYVLNPVYDDWLLGRGDLTQHYLGWCFYRRGQWIFPIGLTNQLAYPNNTSVIFTDSIPLFAVFFKILSPILPDTFQYFGWWGLICFILQGIVASMILIELQVDRLQIVVGSLIFVLSPIVIERMFRHTSLGAHWIVLLSIYYFIKHKNTYRDIKKTSLCWGIVGGLIGAVHMYYLPMCAAFAGAYVIASLMKERRFRIRYIMPMAAFTAGLFLVTYILGGFSTDASPDSDGLGEYGFNLNGFFNAKGYSRWLPNLETYQDGQYEGLAYLGIGIYILLIFAVIYVAIMLTYAKKTCNRDVVIYMFIYTVIILGLTTFAVSPQVSFGSRLLFVLTDSSTLTHYWSIFRSSGRIIWLVYYLIDIGVIVCYDRLWKLSGRKRSVALMIFAVCTFLQIYDMGKKLASQRQTFANKVTYDCPLKSEIWNELAERESIKHIVWVSHNIDYGPIMHFAKYAYDNGWTMNNFYFARGINVNEDTRQSVENLNDSCIYLFKTDETEYIVGNISDFDLNFYEADGYIIGTVFPIVY